MPNGFNLGGTLSDIGGAAVGAAGGGVVGGVLGTRGGRRLAQQGVGAAEGAFKRSFGARDPDEEAFEFERAEEQRALLEREIAMARARGTPELRGRQLTLADQLAAQARGEGPSLAGTQLQEATDRNLAQALALQASAGGTSPALAQRQIAQQRAEVGQQAALQSAQTRASEQQAAQAQLGGVLAQTRGQELQQQAINDALVRDFVRAGLSLDEAQVTANIEQQRLLQQGRAAEQQAAGQIFGGLLGAAGSAAGAFVGG